MRWAALLAGIAALSVVAGGGQAGAQSTLGAPTASVSSPTTNSLTVTWTAPSDDGGSAITAYDLRHIPTDDDESVEANWTVVDDVWVTGGGTLTYTLDDLEDGVGYDVQVRAVNANGDGPWSATAAGTTTDHGGTTGAATDLALGSSLAGRLSPATDEDVFEITVANDGEVWIYATGPLDTVGELLDSGGTVLAEHDDGTILDVPWGFEFRENLDAGTYYVRVSSYEDEAEGSYRIHAETYTDPGSTFATAKDIALDSFGAGRIGPLGGTGGDRDYFKFVLTTTTDVWVLAFGTKDDGAAILDTHGRLYGSTQNFLQAGDDSDLFGNRQGFTLRRSLAAGTYYLRVEGYSVGDVGPYTLHVRTATEPGSTTATATPLTLGIPQTGRLTSSSDQDYFSLTLAEDTYVFLYAVTFGGALPLTPTVLDDQGTEVPMHVVPHSSWVEKGSWKYSFSLWGRFDAGTHTIRITGSSGRYLLDPLISPYNRMYRQCTGITTPQSDPWYGCQWHLNNTGQFLGGAMQDINVESVWTGGNMGAGINIAVVDDGLEFDHVDLVDNVVATRNHDFSGRGTVYHPLDTHGTAVAGIIAARDNTIGVRGVAPRAKIFSYNLLGTGSSGEAASAMYRSEDADVTAISNNSWGFTATGLPSAPAATWERAVVRGVTEGYGGKGILYVWAAGNDHRQNSNANLDGYTSFYAVTAVCAVGYDDQRSDYSELGANLWVCGPSSSGRVGLPGIATTNIPDRYRNEFGGTSAATPIVSGVAALVRAANTALTWRDVKLILAGSARKNDSGNTGWDEGALKYGSISERYEFNHEYGFGMVDAAAAVALANGWTNVPTLRALEVDSGELRTLTGVPGLAVPDRSGSTITTLETTLSLDDYVEFIEFVEVRIEFQHDRFRDLRVEIQSPSGEVSELSVPTAEATSGQYYNSHRFGSAKHLGESGEGTWTLKLTDEHEGQGGRVMSWRVTAFGHGHNPGYVELDAGTALAGGVFLTWSDPTDVGGSAVTSYDVRYSYLRPTEWTEVTGVGSPDNREYTLSGLRGLTWHQIQMRAVNDAGPGPWSETIFVQPLRSHPDPPRSVRVAGRNEALAATWREPSIPGVGPIAAYHVRYIEEDAADKADDQWTLVEDAWSTGGGELRYIIRGLTNGTKYEVQVQAENSVTVGAWSNVATGTPQDVNGPAEFPTNEDGKRSIPENTADGVDIGDPIAARDDESDTLTYSLTSGAANFDIDTATGQLSTKAALDHERTPRHTVTVAVHDGKASDGTESTATDDTISVTIEIEDVDEPPAVTGSGTVTVRENATAVGTYRARDPEGAATTFTWSLTGDDHNAFDISDRGVLTFDPAPNFEARADTNSDNTYEVTVEANDGSLTGTLDVQVTVQDVDEAPEISGDATYTVAEGGSTSVGTYSATDPEGTDVTWLTLTGSEARYFTFDATTGDLSFADTPDFEARSSDVYRVNVRASDENNRTATFPVTITVTNVNEGPVISGPATPTLNEVINPTPGQVVTVGTYTKRDPDRPAQTTSWGPVGSSTVLSGNDRDAFEFNQQTGRLTFVNPPDFEDGEEYEVTLTANDGSLDGTLDVTVTITNLDETGAVTLDRRTPVINRAIAATLTDPDTVVSVAWQWQRSKSRTSGWADIAGATSSSYTPIADDRTSYLRATAAYEDGHGPNKTRQAVTEFTVSNDRASNTPPELPDSVEPISIPENTRPGGNVGSPVRATDPENDPLQYSLSGSSDFVIDSRTAQIKVAAGVTLDFDSGGTSYSLTVTADDGFGGTDTAGVTVNLTDVNEAPEATDDSASTNEDEAASINVLSNDSDPESATADLSVSGVRRPRNGTATVEADNTITYTPNADYNGADTFTYTVSDGTLTAVGTVSVNVRAVNDAPQFAAATAERFVSERATEGDNVGAPVTATDIDGGDTLAYGLSGADAFSFDIDRDRGQITVASGVSFDIATQETYNVTVQADDGNGGTASIDVTITVSANPIIQPPIIGPSVPGGGGGGGPSGPTPSLVDYEWTVKHDLEALDSAHAAPTGMWIVGQTLWLANNPDGPGDAVFAYDLESGERVEAREFALDEANRAPRGAWSDGETVWVSDSGRDKLFAYDLASGERLPQRDIELAARNRDARGLWSDGETVWVLNRNPSLFAYDLASGALLAEYALDSSNRDPQGLWSDGVTVWVSDHGAKRLFAYRLPTREAAEAADEDASLERVRDEDFTHLTRASNNSPRGIWSDGDVMYVADASDGKVYTYNMPDAIDARLASLSLSGVNIGEFSPGKTEYEGVIAEGVTETTVTAEAMQRRTTVAIDPPAAGGRVALAGTSAISVTVTSADGARTKVYRVAFESAVTELTLGPTWESFEWPGLDGAVVADALREAGIVEEVLVIYHWDEAHQRWLGFFPGFDTAPGLSTLATFTSGETYLIAVEEPITWRIALAGTP